MQHKIVKRYYARTNKNQFEIQIAKQERRARLLTKIKDREGRQNKSSLHSKRIASCTPAQNLIEELVYTDDPRAHHHISHSTLFPVIILSWIQENSDDPAFEVCDLLSI